MQVNEHLGNVIGREDLHDRVTETAQDFLPRSSPVVSALTSCYSHGPLHGPRRRHGRHMAYLFPWPTNTHLNDFLLLEFEDVL